MPVITQLLYYTILLSYYYHCAQIFNKNKNTNFIYVLRAYWSSSDSWDRFFSYVFVKNLCI